MWEWETSWFSPTLFKLCVSKHLRSVQSSHFSPTQRCNVWINIWKWMAWYTSLHMPTAFLPFRIRKMQINLLAIFLTGNILFPYFANSDRNHSNVTFLSVKSAGKIKDFSHIWGTFCKWYGNTTPVNNVPCYAGFLWATSQASQSAFTQFVLVHFSSVIN